MTGAAELLAYGTAVVLADACTGSLRGAVFGLLAAAVLFGAAGRTSALFGLERDLDDQVGRLSDARNQARLAGALVDLGATSPAVLEYDLMSLMDGWSGGEVRPWLYARSALGAGRSDCLFSDDPRWLARIVEAHAGGHVVVAWGVIGNLGGAQPSSWASPVQVVEAARSVGLTATVAAELRDDRGRWFATIWAIGGS